jgi:hypothetical protein
MNDITEVLHRIEAKLYPNYLGKGGAYIARSKAEAPLSIEQICASAKNRGGFTGQYEDLVEHTHTFINEMIYQLLDGFSAQIGNYFSLHTKIGGTYNHETDHIDSEKITVTFRVLAGLKELLVKIKVQNEGLAGDGAYIDEIADVHSGAVNNILSPGGMVHITGHKIKVEGSDPAVGLWFVNQTGPRTKVSENLGLNRPTEVMALIPALPPGSYKVEILTQYAGGSAHLKEPRTIKFDTALTVS